MKILIVEDNALIARAIEAAGESLQMTCVHATDGWEAIEKLETEDYAAIVIDTDLPLHSGFGVLTYLREEIGQELRNVVVMTSCDDESFRRKISAEHVNVIARTQEIEEIARAVSVARGN